MHAEKPKFNRAGDCYAVLHITDTLKGLSESDRQILAAITLSTSVNGGQRETRVKNREIADTIGVSESCIEKAIPRLKGQGFMEISHDRKRSDRRYRGIRIPRSDSVRQHVAIPKSHPVWTATPTAFWVWVTLRRCISDDSDTTFAGNAKIAELGWLTDDQIRRGLNELEKTGTITRTMTGSNKRTIAASIHLIVDTGQNPTRVPDQPPPEYRTKPHPSTGQNPTPNKIKNLLSETCYQEPSAQSPQPPTGAVGGVLPNGPNSRPHKPEPKPRTPIDPFEGWPEHCRAWWEEFRIRKNPRDMKPEWIESGFLRYAFDDVRAKIEADPLSIKNPAAYIASMLTDEGFQAYLDQRERHARQSPAGFDRLPAATEIPEPKPANHAAGLEPHESGMATRLPEPDRKPELPATVRYLADRISPAAAQWAWQMVAIRGIDPNDWRLVETLRKVHAKGNRPSSANYFEPVFRELPPERPKRADEYTPEDREKIIAGMIERANQREAEQRNRAAPLSGLLGESREKVPQGARNEPVPAATEPARPVDQVKPIARPNPPAAETRAEPASAVPRESSKPVPPRERHEPVPGRIEPPVEQREERPGLRIAEVTSSRAEAREAMRRREHANCEEYVQKEIGRQVSRWRNERYMELIHRETPRGAREQIRVEESAKRREIEAIVRNGFEPVQADRMDWPTGRTDPDQKAKAPGTRRIGAHA